MHIVEVNIEEHEALPQGCCMRFRASGEPRPVRYVTYESEDGREGTWHVEAQHSDGSRAPAMAIEVDDSGAGTSTLIYGGNHGLRLTPTFTTSDERIAEPYLLVSGDAVLPDASSGSSGTCSK